MEIKTLPKKKVLIIANLFHAFPRMTNVADRFHTFGYEPWIVTPPLDAKDDDRLGLPKDFRRRVKLIEVSYRGDVLWFWRKLFRFGREKNTGSITEHIKKTLGVSGKKSVVEKMLYAYQAVFGYPDTEKYWIKPVLKEIEKVAAFEHFDAIISSSPYPTNHLIAKRIKMKHNIPWLADFRDPWAENHNYEYGRFRRALDYRLEKKTIRYADAISAASPGYAEKEERLHRQKVTVITNGFDPDLSRETPALTKKFTITYTGSIYSGKQNPELFLKSIRELIDEKRLEADDIEIRFYGKNLGWLHDLIQKYALINVVREYGQIGQPESLLRQRNSQVLLIFGWEDQNETGVFPLKTFEYLAAKRPIIISGGTAEEEIKDIIRNTGSGQAGINELEIKNIISAYYADFKKTGSVPYHGIQPSLERYSWLSITKQFAAALDGITKK